MEIKKLEELLQEARDAKRVIEDGVRPAISSYRNEGWNEKTKRDLIEVSAATNSETLRRIIYSLWTLNNGAKFKTQLAWIQEFTERLSQTAETLLASEELCQSEQFKIATQFEQELIALNKDLDRRFGATEPWRFSFANLFVGAYCGLAYGLTLALLIGIMVSSLLPGTLTKQQSVSGAFALIFGFTACGAGLSTVKPELF